MKPLLLILMLATAACSKQTEPLATAQIQSSGYRIDVAPADYYRRFVIILDLAGSSVYTGVSYVPAGQTYVIVDYRGSAKVLGYRIQKVERGY